MSGFAAVEVKKKGGRSVFESFILCRRGGHSIEYQTVKRTSSYRLEVGEGPLISLIIKALGSTPLGGEGCSTLVHLSRASLSGGGGDSTDTRRKACLRLEEEGGGDSTATRRKA